MYEFYSNVYNNFKEKTPETCNNGEHLVVKSTKDKERHKMCHERDDHVSKKLLKPKRKNFEQKNNGYFFLLFAICQAIVTAPIINLP
jgi:hypothetical protein